MTHLFLQDAYVILKSFFQCIHYISKFIVFVIRHLCFSNLIIFFFGMILFVCRFLFYPFTNIWFCILYLQNFDRFLNHTSPLGIVMWTVSGNSRFGGDFQWSHMFFHLYITNGDTCNSGWALALPSDSRFRLIHT